MTAPRRSAGDPAIKTPAGGVAATGLNADREISRDWSDEDLSLYLDRCQIDTPDRLIAATWAHIYERRDRIGKVVDFGAGDGRFARHGAFDSYVGYEVDWKRCVRTDLPDTVRFVHRCAFAETVNDADLCIGNPPFVRNQDLPAGWRTKVADQLQARSGIALSGLANAWQYFFLLSLLSAGDKGLCALVVPYEWVSRPSTQALRAFIIGEGWDVDVYRLEDASFESVLTTSSITVIDKACRSSRWRFFTETGDGKFEPLPTASDSAAGYLPYVRPARGSRTPRAVRGLSPGTQEVLTLTDAERSRFGLRIGRDVVPCVTSFRVVPPEVRVLDEAAFLNYFRAMGRKCWLLRTDRAPSRQLSAYLEAVPQHDRATSTCRSREVWWKFNMPDVPDLLVATTFKGAGPKIIANTFGARAVGGVAGIHGLPASKLGELLDGLAARDIKDRIIAHANGLRKIEINQLNGLLAEIFGRSVA